MAEPTPYEAMRLFAEGLLEELEDEHSCSEVAVYRSTLADIDAERDEHRLREAALLDRWSFKRGTLRERLEWARVQHALSVNDDAPTRARTLEAHREWHRLCAAWYAAMVRDLDELLAAVQRLTEEVYVPHHTPSSESGPEEWDVELLAPEAETVQAVLRHLSVSPTSVGGDNPLDGAGKVGP